MGFSLNFPIFHFFIIYNKLLIPLFTTILYRITVDIL